MRSRARAAAPTVLAALSLLVALAACGGDADSSEEPAPAPTTAAPESETASAAAAPTTADLEEAHRLYHDLAGVLDGANGAAADYQAAVKEARDEDPEGFVDSPQVAAAVEELEAAVTSREAALDELAAHPALGDEELAAAYDVFVTAYARATAYQDGYNASYPVFLQSDATCQDVFVAGPKDATSFTQYAEEWLVLQQRAAAPCRALTDRLAGSANEDVVAVAARWEELIEERLELIRGINRGTYPVDRAPRFVERINQAFLKDYERLTGFSERLGELFPLDEYEAIDAIFEDRVGPIG